MKERVLALFSVLLILTLGLMACGGAPGWPTCAPFPVSPESPWRFLLVPLNEGKGLR